MTDSTKPSSDGHSLVTNEDATPIVTRTSLGRFIKGSSGNPKGRARGSKNRTTLMKQAIEEMVVSELVVEAAAIFQVALQKAKDGENDMIKFTLGEILKEVRKAPTEEDEHKGGPRTVAVTIHKYYGDTATPPTTVDGDFTEISEDSQ